MSQCIIFFFDCTAHEHTKGDGKTVQFNSSMMICLTMEPISDTQLLLPHWNYVNLKFKASKWYFTTHMSATKVSRNDTVHSSHTDLILQVLTTSHLGLFIIFPTRSTTAAHIRDISFLTFLGFTLFFANIWACHSRTSPDVTNTNYI